MPRYAQLYEQVGESNDIGFLLETNPLAAALFLVSVARADLYGILPGEARDYRTRVCPAAAVPVEDVEVALQAMIERGMCTRYEANDRKYLYICSYHSYQQVRWDRTGRPSNPLPQDWVVPRTLVDSLDSEKRKTAAFYGLSVDLRPLPASSWSASGLTISGYISNKTGPGVVREYSGTSPGVLPGVLPTAAVSVSASVTAENDSETPSLASGSQLASELHPVLPAKGERDLAAGEKKVKDSDKARRAATLDKEIKKRSILAARLSKLTCSQQELFEELVAYHEEKKDGKPLTVSQQLGYLDIYRTNLEHHDPERVMHWVRESMARVDIDEPLRYAIGCVKREEEEAGGGNGGVKAGTGGNGNGSRLFPGGLGPWHTYEYEAMRLEEDAALKAGEYEKQGALATKMQAMRAKHEGG
jgi:hypothetical protein